MKCSLYMDVFYDLMMSGYVHLGRLLALWLNQYYECVFSMGRYSCIVVDLAYIDIEAVFSQG